MVLKHCNISVELREIILKNRPTDLYKASSKGTVPVLITNENIVIDESLDIMFWAIKITNNKDIYNCDNQLQDNMIYANDNEFKNILDKYKYSEKDSEEYILYRDKAYVYLSKYDSILSQSKYLVSNTLQLVDIAILPFIRQFYNVNQEYFINKYTYLYKWLNTIIKSNLFKLVMYKYDEWSPKDAIKIINFKENG